jgi:hypothetical protein
MSIHRTLLMAWALCIIVGITGCVPKQPKVVQPQPGLAQTREASGGMGSFNLQKRHGLGGWDKPAGPSEQELIQHIANAPATLPQAAPQPAQPKPAQSKKEIR